MDEKTLKEFRKELKNLFFKYDCTPGYIDMGENYKGSLNVHSRRTGDYFDLLKIVMEGGNLNCYLFEDNE